MKRLCLALTFLAALLLPLALPNDIYFMGNPLIGIFCLTPFFLALIMAPSFGFASIIGMLFGGISTLFAHYWLLFYNEYSVWTVSGVVLGYMGYHALLAPILHGLSRINSSYRVFILAAAWAIYEYMKSSGFLAFPWGLLPHSFVTVRPMIQFIDITGLWGLSFLIALINTLLAEGLLLFFPEYGTKSIVLARISKFFLFLFILVMGYGLYSLLKPLGTDKKAAFILVQHNDNPWMTGKADEALLKAQDLSRPDQEEESPDLIVWSETAVKYYLTEEQLDAALRLIPRLRPMDDFIRETGTYFLIGAPFWPLEAEDYQNSALLISPQGELVDHYGKQHLVPLGETVPFWEFRPVEVFFSEVLGLTSGWCRGEGYTIFEIPLKKGGNLTFGTPICFEDAYPDLCRRFIRDGAELLINLTNVSWSQRESAEMQMFIASLFRSIENRCYLIRSTNGGVTSVIGPKGEIKSMLDLFTADKLAAQIGLPTEKQSTPYTLYGDYFPYVLALILILFLIRQRLSDLGSRRFDKRARIRQQQFLSL